MEKQSIQTTNNKSLSKGTNQNRNKWLIVTLVIAFIALLASVYGPLGFFWGAPAMPEGSEPTSNQLILLVVPAIAEALTFGFGISFLIFGYSMVKAVQPTSKRLTTAAYFSIAWLLSSWWPHDNLHDAEIGESINAVIAIDYGFHITLMVAGVILSYFFMTLLRQQTTSSKYLSSISNS